MIAGFEIRRVEPLAGGHAFGETGAYERVVGVARGDERVRPAFAGA